MATLKEAAQKRRSTRTTKAPKATTPLFSSQPEASPQTTVIAPTQSVAIASPTISVAVPGLAPIAPDAISGMMPQFDHNAYHVADPLNPPDSIPQLSESDFNRNETIYAGGIRALKSTGMAYDLTKERFTTERKKASAFGAGVAMATEFEKVKGSYLDYLNQVEISSQKTSNLGVSQHKTTVDAAIAVHSKEELTQKQELARIKAETAKAQVKDAQSKLGEFQKSLGLATAK